MIVALLLAASRPAHAHDEPGGARPTEGSPDVAGAEGERAEKEEAEPAWETSVDVAGGATTTAVLTAGRPGRIETPPANVYDSTRVTAYSFLFGVERHLGDRFTVGLRVPVVAADLSSRSSFVESRSVVAAGNLELEGAFVIARGNTWSLVATLEVALPTSGGKEPPTPQEVADDPTKRYEYKRYDAFAALHAAAATRGSYESALFETGNLGLVPKISGSIRLGNLTLSPMVKLENLFDVATESDEVYINELVGGVRAGYRVVPAFEPGVHVWVRELHEHTHTDNSFSTVAVVEPYVRFHLGAFTPTVSAIVPFAGDLADAKTFGVRAGFVGEL